MQVATEGATADVEGGDESSEYSSPITDEDADMLDLLAPLPGGRVVSKGGIGTRTRAGLEAGPSGSPTKLRRAVLEREGRKRGTPEGGRSGPRRKGKAAKK